MWSQITEDALNKELAARRLQPMIMYQAQDPSTGGEGGPGLNPAWVILIVLVALGGLAFFCRWVREDT